jgi:hypothetical protein
MCMLNSNFTFKKCALLNVFLFFYFIDLTYYFLMVCVPLIEHFSFFFYFGEFFNIIIKVKWRKILCWQRLVW